ncbi:MAG: hypothetical protein AB1781_09355 [Pseudomonadota bacterium]
MIVFRNRLKFPLFLSTVFALGLFPVALAAEPTEETETLAVPVDVTPLEMVDPNSVGLLDDAAGGFGVGMWEGTDRKLVEQLLPKLPAAAPSRVLRSLQRRLLLSMATAPGDGVLQANLLPLRFERLAAMGETEAVLALAQIVPAAALDESMAIVIVESLFLVGQTETACQEVRNRIRDYPGAHWQRMLVFCESLAGETEAVELGLALLGEMPEKTKPVFFQLIGAILGREDVAIASLPEPSPLEVVMIAAAKREVPPDAGTATHAASLRLLAGNGNAPMALRQVAGERAEAIGSLATEDLAALYGAVSFPAEAIAAAGDAAMQDPSSRALLYQAARAASSPEIKARLLERAWQAASVADPTGALYGTSVRINLPVLDSLTPTPELAWFAAAAGQALLLGGRWEEAATWLDLARREAFATAAAEKARDRLSPYVQLAGQAEGMSLEADRLDAWLAGRPEGAAGKAEAARLFGLLTAMGETVSGAEWAQLVDEAPQTTAVVPSAAIRHGLAEASAAGRLGETVLLTLLSLGERGPAAASAVTLEAAVLALRAVGLDRDARALALEASLLGEP